MAISDFKDLNKAYRKISLKYHPDKNNGDNTTFMNIEPFVKLFNNLPLVHTGASIPSVIKQSSFFQSNLEFQNKNIQERNQYLEEIIKGENQKLIGIYREHEKNCKGMNIQDNRLVEDNTFPISLNVYNKLATAFIEKIPDENKDSYSKLFENYRTFYQKCFVEEKKIDKAEAEKLKQEEDDRKKAEAEKLKQEEDDRKKAEAEKLKQEEDDRKKAEAEKLKQEEDDRKKAEAEKLKQEEDDRKKAEAEKLKQEEDDRKKAEAEKLKQEEDDRKKAELEETIMHKGNLVLLERIKTLKHSDKILNKVAKTLHSSKIEFTEKGAQELARSYEVDSNRNEHNSEEIYLSHLCIDLGICEL